ncbi:GTP cyclohydrolase II [Candidatus Enterovibrio altilux]|uniref:GTP cyclohydrolase-2 n=2 Tax=Candidatus Enterovibrio altilux TaxID=1927128 RepID=A0A291B6J6_9GAMM|nr:GTP cyclohydrolase II [Candidatus Enterovibrio luxaltus]
MKRELQSMAKIRARIALNVGVGSQTPAEILSFEGLNTENEHVAIIFKNVDQFQDTPLVRIHSECLTGDVFHSSRCDCGEQLEETIQKMGEQGGILLYLRQEGRGIGLYNKLDAYGLQSSGMDTYQANNYLGFPDDLRSFEDAADMLKALGVTVIQLITNNPKKIKEIQEYGIELSDVIGTKAHLKNDNRQYLQAKISYGKHKLTL